MPTPRRRLLQAALVILPVLAFAQAGLAAEAPHAAPLAAEQLHQLIQDIPGAEYATANQLKNEALHAAFMGADLPAIEPKLRAFAIEYARVAGTDPQGMQAHVMEVGAQIVALAKDPNFQAHVAALHAAH
jgi:hypothetical protein